jgi:hypothetical protein
MGALRTHCPDSLLGGPPLNQRTISRYGVPAPKAGVAAGVRTKTRNNSSVSPGRAPDQKRRQSPAGVEGLSRRLPTISHVHPVVRASTVG